LKKLLTILLVLAIFAACKLIESQHRNNDKNNSGQNTRKELQRIQFQKELRAVVDYNSTDYFIYKGHPMGFQYELLKAFSDYMGVELLVYISNDMNEAFAGLNSGEYDLIAQNLTATNDRGKVVDFTEPIALTRQVLVQRNPAYPYSSETSFPKTKFISKQADLENKTIHVKQGSTAVQRIKSISEEIAAPINLVEEPELTSEQLIEKVAQGEIDYAVCDEVSGQVSQNYYPWIDVSVPVSFNQKASWAVRKNSMAWKNYIDKWIVAFKKTREYRDICSKYFESEHYSGWLNSEYNLVTGGKISQYDGLIRSLASTYGVDWRLVASIIKNESDFDRYANSKKGAIGLMQLMPDTGGLYHVNDLNDPKENIRAGIAYLLWLDKLFKPLVPGATERLKFVLGAYNIGIGHILDARKLAVKYGKDSTIWKDNVDYCLLQKSSRVYYTDPVVKSGFCNGQKTCAYVKEVFEDYRHYCNFTPGEVQSDALSTTSTALQASLQ
jgi:membrane-bound lytic murein transglycosylase F